MLLTIFYIHIIFIGNAFKFLTKQLLNHSFINNDTVIYITKYINLFYIFTKV
jgi:hypothetical protein